MSKKSAATIIILTLCLCASICILGYKNLSLKIETKGGLETSSLSYLLADNNGESEYSYSVELTNTNGKDIFIKTIEPSINESIKNKILSKETTVIVNKNIKPNGKIQVNGKIIIDTSEIFAQDIQNLITDIKISTEETVKLK
ncbi:hypothetical protein CLHOM_23010 [Clostridium homopropionicum DSM 5847]|uniref:Uncharacterized protein n=1 Tax=Clostridium homopropionicum DSM 5847 TaxID=1121318 RepID=A0A0L6Z8A5_9CLOT|nr:hypothetical protein [Clostridium homopropionicum]KOA19195.1 hypothetical protein CLHOM_23010 [Clostridium homopropionicum DSM 5847]SFG17069.1 hypothetical protein SAMN04488501_10658 [Clostridium homopropionicum]